MVSLFDHAYNGAVIMTISYAKVYKSSMAHNILGISQIGVWGWITDKIYTVWQYVVKNETNHVLDVESQCYFVFGIEYYTETVL